MNKENKPVNHIEEYLKQQEENPKVKSSKELFTAKKEDIDLKTDLTIEEIHYINVLMVNDEFLKSKGLKPVFKIFYEEFMRLKVSLNRQSRGEFVRINTEQRADELLANANNLNSIIKSKRS